MTCLPNVQLRAQGAAILRVVAELRDFLKDEDVPESFFRDLDTLDSVGRWLFGASSVMIVPASPQTGCSNYA